MRGVASAPHQAQGQTVDRTVRRRDDGDAVFAEERADDPEQFMLPRVMLDDLEAENSVEPAQ